MERFHARYPFLDDARNAVEAADVDLAELLENREPAVERGRERVEQALISGTVEPVEPTQWNVRAELLSYPVARALVSLLDTPGAIDKYTAAEAATAYQRFVADFESDLQLKSSSTTRLSLEEFLADFDLAGTIEPIGDDRFAVDVIAYLQLIESIQNPNFSLASKPLQDGVVPVNRHDLYTLLREAVRRRVADGLPLAVPDPVASVLEADVEALKDSVEEIDPPSSFETVDPDQFPPCVQHLLLKARAGETLARPGRFSLLTFLTSVGMKPDEILSRPEFSEIESDTVREQLSRMYDENGGSVMVPPSCAVMDAYGDCVNKDSLCDSIDHPLNYYGARLSDPSSLQ